MLISNRCRERPNPISLDRFLAAHYADSKLAPPKWANRMTFSSIAGGVGRMVGWRPGPMRPRAEGWLRACSCARRLGGPPMAALRLLTPLCSETDRTSIISASCGGARQSTLLQPRCHACL